MRLRLKSESEGVEYCSTPRWSLFDRGCAYDCSQNNRSYGRNRIDALLEVGLYAYGVKIKLTYIYMDG